MDDDNSDKEKSQNDDETQEIQNLCSEAESNAEALVAPLRRTVEELDKLYDGIKDDSKRGAKVKEICNEIDALIFKLKEMISATSLEISQVTKTADVEEKVDGVCGANEEKE